LPPNEKFDDEITEMVVVKDVAEEFVKIEKLEPGIRKLCKMDCEGAEFEILNHLFKTGRIAVMDIYLIEWHDIDPADIVRQFLNSGFEVIKSTAAHLTTGMIYAIKHKEAT
jgi:Methyltransferase FkbM domain